MLRARGVDDGAVLVIYGDGGAEPYRLWWTLREVLGRDARLLDGGLQAWKARLLPTARDRTIARAGAFGARPERRPRAERWEEVAAIAGAQLIDTRTAAEFSGAQQDDRAERAGHIPGAVHLSWGDMLVSLDEPRLRPLDELRRAVERAGIDVTRPIVGYCQSATRSSVTYYALLQLGVSEDGLRNYGGSWAEYSRLDTPIERASDPH
jgi:thiosulfate/3-mercaptopyruvate sulfurtransferase